VDGVVKTAKSQNTHSEIWEEDLQSVSNYINDNRVRQMRVGVIAPSQLTAEDLLNDIKIHSLSREEAGFLVFGVLNGFWNQPRWTKLYESINNGHRSFMNAFLPFLIERERYRKDVGFDPLGLEQHQILKTTGHAGDSYHAMIEIRSLGVEKSENPEYIRLVNNEYLHDLLPSRISEAGDVLILATTYYPPEQPERHPKSIIDALMTELAVLFEQKKTNSVVHNDELNLVEAFEESASLLENDKAVLTSTKVIAQSPNPTRTVRLVEDVYHSLFQRDVHMERALFRETQLSAIRSALPIIPQRDVVNKVFPYPLGEITKILVPKERVKISKDKLKVLIGEELIFGEAYYWEFLTTFCLLGGQQIGKSSFLEMLALRLSGQLPLGSVTWIYDGTDAVAEREGTERDYGWTALARFINRNINTSALEPSLESGVVFAENYTSADQLHSDLAKLREAGARLIVFSALEKQHTNYNIEKGFFDAYLEDLRRAMENQLPGAFFIDEVEHIASDERAETIFFEIAQHASKRNQMFGWTAHTVNALPSGGEKDVRRTAKANTKKFCIGPTSLIENLHNEAEINVELHPERAKFLQELITDLAKQGVPGTFVETKWGGDTLIPFRSLVLSDAAQNFIHRKGEEARRRYGL
jgi:hypothetical protein